MSQTISIPAGEQGVVRLFRVVVERNAIAPWQTADENNRWLVPNALGVNTLDPKGVEIFDTRDLEGFGLSGYLIEGLGIATADIADMAAQLDAITGFVLVVRSTAFSGAATELRPQDPLRHIGTFFEDRPPVKFDPLPSKAAQKQPPENVRKRPSDAAVSGRVATAVLLFLALFVFLLVWMSG